MRQKKILATVFYQQISNFFAKDMIDRKDRFYAEVILNECIFLQRTNQTSKIKTYHFSKKFNIPRVKVLRILKILTARNFLSRKTCLASNSYSYIVDLQYVQKITKCEDFAKAKFMLVPNSFFYEILTEKKRADLDSIFLLVSLHFKSFLTSSIKIEITFRHLTTFLKVCRTTAKSKLRKLEKLDYISKAAILKRYNLTHQTNLQIKIKNFDSFDRQNKTVSKEKNELLKKEATASLNPNNISLGVGFINLENVDKSVDNSEKITKKNNFLFHAKKTLPKKEAPTFSKPECTTSKRVLKKRSNVDNSVDKSVDNLFLCSSKFDQGGGKNGTTYIYNKTKSIIDDFCNFRFSLGKSIKSKKSMDYLKSCLDDCSYEQRLSKILKENPLLKTKDDKGIQSIMKDKNDSLKRFKIDNKNLKTLDELIPSVFNTIKYENFIFSVQKLASKKTQKDYSENFVKKLIKKLIKKYPNKKFYSLSAVKSYFVKALQGEKLSEKIYNNPNFCYSSKLNRNKMIGE